MDTKSAGLLKRHIRELCTKIESRMIGTKGDHASAAYAESVFRGHGLEVKSNRMSCTGWDLESTTLRVGRRAFEAIGNMYSPAGRASGDLALAEADLPDADFRRLKGKVVAVYGNFEPFPARLNGFAGKAERAGVASVVVIDTDPTTCATKLIRDLKLKRMPVMSVSLETGMRLAKLEGKRAECAVRARRYPSDTRDVIGILHGGPREICIEAHRDAAPDTPSADDNGSGSAVLLELARLLSLSAHRHTIRFVSATAEEFGNVGTPVYARRFAEELKKIDLMINIDCVGNYLCPLKVYVQEGDRVAPLVDRMVRPYRSMGVVRTKDRWGGHISEYLPKSANAVNVIEVWANARIHTPRDEPANLNYAKMADVAHFLRDLIERYDTRGL